MQHAYSKVTTGRECL